MRFEEFFEDGAFSPALVADALRTTKSEIAATLGLGGDAFTRTSRIRARKTQTRLRQMLEILNLVLWRWDDARPARVELIDDEGRLAGPDGG